KDCPIWRWFAITSGWLILPQVRTTRRRTSSKRRARLRRMTPSLVRRSTRRRRTVPKRPKAKPGPQPLLQRWEHVADRPLLPDRGTFALYVVDGRRIAHQVEVIDQGQKPDICRCRTGVVVALPVGIGKTRAPVARQQIRVGDLRREKVGGAGCQEVYARLCVRDVRRYSDI